MLSLLLIELDLAELTVRFYEARFGPPFSLVFGFLFELNMRFTGRLIVYRALIEFSLCDSSCTAFLRRSILILAASEGFRLFLSWAVPGLNLLAPLVS